MVRIWRGLLLSIAWVATAQATELSGIVVYDSDRSGADMRAWHTSLDPAAAPIGIAREIPPASFTFALLNRSDGEIAIPIELGGASPYLPTTLVFTAFWQLDPDRLLPNATVNFFFNRDTLHPGISVNVPMWAGSGLTRFFPNLAPTVLSLYLREVENDTDTTYVDGDHAVALTALYMANPTLFLPADRVGFDDLAPDHVFDAIMVFELTVTPYVPSPSVPRRSGPMPTPRIVEPLRAIVGPALPGTDPGAEGIVSSVVPTMRPTPPPKPIIPTQPGSTPDSSGTAAADPAPTTETPKAVAGGGTPSPPSPGAHTTTTRVTGTTTPQPTRLHTGTSTPARAARPTPAAKVTGTAATLPTTPTRRHRHRGPRARSRSSDPSGRG